MSMKDKLAYAFLIFGISLAFIFYATPIQILSAYGHSMEPTIETGDAVVTLPTDVYELKKGDIITFRHEGLLITHRIHGFEEGKIRTKGDSMGEKDPYLVNPSEVTGKLFLVIPYAGNVLRYANSPAGFVLLILVPAALIIFDESKKIVTKRGSKEKEVSKTRPT